MKTAAIEGIRKAVCIPRRNGGVDSKISFLYVNLQWMSTVFYNGYFPWHLSLWKPRKFRKSCAILVLVDDPSPPTETLPTSPKYCEVLCKNHNMALVKSMAIHAERCSLVVLG